jgi:hypothetical protein
VRKKARTHNAELSSGEYRYWRRGVVWRVVVMQKDCLLFQAAITFSMTIKCRWSRLFGPRGPCHLKVDVDVDVDADAYLAMPFMQRNEEVLIHDKVVSSNTAHNRTHPEC